MGKPPALPESHCTVVKLRNLRRARLCNRESQLRPQLLSTQVLELLLAKQQLTTTQGLGVCGSRLATSSSPDALGEDLVIATVRHSAKKKP